MRNLLIVAALAAFIGNAQAADDSNATLCTRYHTRFHSKSIRAELVKRDALTSQEWAAVDAREPFVGMSDTAALCMYGKPRRVVSSTTTADGTAEEWEYQPTTKWVYLTLANGKVSAVQHRNRPVGAY